ncbi:92bc842d-5948-4310-ac10-f20ac5590d55 [Sclerotinia trifoliorum]|uniref:non-specific serine/threonine protein kinase n=1 Tax=Sclerotinia trifoliorum TaxID=28548 RepID=A0A8H2VXF7_9HELO|nr:92bc842d-5948-4310-ac10-f20ac5590d55 [Sclerotinia trifoliorum]
MIISLNSFHPIKIEMSNERASYSMDDASIHSNHTEAIDDANTGSKHVESTDNVGTNLKPNHCESKDDVKIRLKQHIETNYGQGGFHPVHLNDTFKHDRYKIIHKLGHGGFATVWLARDVKRERYVAVKVLASRLSSGSPEVSILRAMKDSSEHIGKPHVMSLLDHFTHQGPNGSHLCLVSEVGGPSIKEFNDCPGEYKGSRRLEASVARNVCLQVINGLDYIHTTGIAHGDLTPANILLQLANIDEWTEDQIHERLGVPQKQEIDCSSSQLPASASSFPDYAVVAINMKEVNPIWLSEKIIIIDFGIAFFLKKSSLDFGTPKSYCAPEFLFGGHRSSASDIWALGCTIFEIRTGSRLFKYNGIPTKDEMLIATVKRLGTLPHKWWAVWREGLEWYKKQTEITTGSKIGDILEQILETGAHDGDVPERTKRNMEALNYIKNAKKNSLNSIPERTEELVRIAENMRTSEASKVLRLVYSSGQRQSGSGSLEDIKVSGSSSNPKGSGSKSSEAKSSEAKSSNTKSSGKTPSSEGVSTGMSKTKTSTAFSEVTEESKINASAHASDPKGNATGEMTIYPDKNLHCGPAHIHSFLEPPGLRISIAEAKSLEDLLRKSLRYLPEERSTASELSKHTWLSGIFNETDLKPASSTSPAT